MIPQSNQYKAGLLERPVRWRWEADEAVGSADGRPFWSILTFGKGGEKD